MITSFKDKVVLVTGAASGIGKQLTLQLLQEGAAVAAIDCNEKTLGGLAAEQVGKRFAWRVSNVTQRSSLEAAVGQLTQELGPIDVAIANAGIGIETSATRLRPEDIEAQIQVNLIGVSNTVGAVLPAMLKRKSGHLVAISSLASYRGLPFMLGYCASKAGLNALMDGLRVELKPHGIAVSTVCPGWVRTPLTANIGLPISSLMDVDYAARRILDVVRKRKAFSAFPAKTLWRVRLLRWLPCTLSDWMTSRAVRRVKRR
jgi:NAD(P)-dependent dehydrogenase (short-subunit alcohol dehydrogenase family)